jgi:predicted ATPase
VRLLTGHFVGRTDELGSLERILGELDRGCPAAIQVVGEPGIGKTRLLRELSARAGARGHLVLAGAASEFERDLPFSVFVDALDEYVAGLEPGRLAVLGDAVQAELAHVFPSLSALAGGRPVSPQHERYRSHRAVRAEMLGALLHREPAAAVLTAVALRPRQTPERLAVTLERARRSEAVTRVELGALTVDEARQLLGERFDVARTALLYRESGGNPFYLEQLARWHARAPQFTSAPEISLTGLDVPAAVVASLAEELTLLSDAGRLVLEGAAVAGDPFGNACSRRAPAA